MEKITGSEIISNLNFKQPNSKHGCANKNKEHQPNNKKYNNPQGETRDLKDMKNTKPFKRKFQGSNPASNPKHVKKHKGGLALALEEYKTKKAEEQKRREENKNKKEEINKAMQRYKEKKAQKLKRLCKKTKKGQPIMKYWIEDLLQKIQNLKLDPWSMNQFAPSVKIYHLLPHKTIFYRIYDPSSEESYLMMEEI